MTSPLIERLARDDRLDRIFIGGRWRRPEGTSRATVIDPSTQQPLADIALGDARDAAAAIAA
ncbi:aldehyde dehydrogenase family protein, partial [Acidovorax cattleyae]|nr:aldehyde dehydrogenase family protein [Paracidovorax cattleyae]